MTGAARYSLIFSLDFLYTVIKAVINHHEKIHKKLRLVFVKNQKRQGLKRELTGHVNVIICIFDCS